LRFRTENKWSKQAQQQAVLIRALAGVQAGGRSGMQMVMRRFYQPPKLPSCTAGCQRGGGGGDSGGRGINQSFPSPGRKGMRGQQRKRDRTLAPRVTDISKGPI